METLMKAQELEFSTTQESANVQNKQNSTLVERTQISGTPFWLHKENDKWFITMGMHKLSPNYDTAEEANEHIEKEKWMTIFHVIAIVTEKTVNEALKTMEEILKKHINNN